VVRLFPQAHVTKFAQLLREAENDSDLHLSTTLQSVHQKVHVKRQGEDQVAEADENL
jgi:hypothetical protein